MIALHIPGEYNIWADQLSRGNLSAFAKRPNSQITLQTARFWPHALKKGRICIPVAQSPNAAGSARDADDMGRRRVVDLFAFLNQKRAASHVDSRFVACPGLACSSEQDSNTKVFLYPG